MFSHRHRQKYPERIGGLGSVFSRNNRVQEIVHFYSEMYKMTAHLLNCYIYVQEITTKILV